MRHTKAKIPGMNEASQIAQRLASLYVTNRDRFVMARKKSIFVPKYNGTPMRLCNSNLEKHILQMYAVSVYGSEEGSRFVCFDLDTGGLDTVKQIVAGIHSTGIHRNSIHVSSSGGKGHHVEVFFDSVVPQGSLMDFFKYVIDLTQCSESSIELRPSTKQAIKLPLSLNPKTNRMCWFLDPDSLCEIESYDYIFNITPMSGLSFVELVKDLPRVTTSREQGMRGKGSRELNYNDTTLPTLTQTGTRHDTMVRIAVSQYHLGTPMEACAGILLDWIEKQDRRYYSSSDKDIYVDVWAISKWVYQKAVISQRHPKHIVSISRHDMWCVLGQPTRTLRKLYFFLLFNKRYTMALSQERIAILIGVSPRNVYQNIKRLVSRGEVLEQKAVAHRTRAGHLCKNANRYTVLRRAISPELVAFLPTEVSHHSIALPKTPEDFIRAYYGTVHAIFPGADLKTRMTGLEYNEYVQWGQSHDSSPIRSNDIPSNKRRR